MFNLLKKAYEPVHKGNVHRASTNLDPEVIAQAKVAHRAKHLAEQAVCVSMFCGQSDSNGVDRFKETFEYWDEWSGGRFVRRENPIASMTVREFLASDYSRETDTRLPIIVPGTICRSNPVTGYHEALNH